MKKLILLVPFMLLACGESEKEKQERLSKELNANINSIKDAGHQKVDSLNRAIKIEEAK